MSELADCVEPLNNPSQIPLKAKERSKEFFRRYCELREYKCSRIEKSNQQGVRTPDLEMSADGVRVIAEAKDLNANDEDIRCWREERQGNTIVHGREPGKRARSLIESARGQLRPHAEAGVPSIVVLYDNILIDGTRAYPSHPSLSFPFSPLTSTDIDVALYGLWQANVRLHPGGQTESLGDTRSRWRLMHDRQVISAVLVLYGHPAKDDLFVFAYHNFWAGAPLPRNIFNGEDDRHFAKASNPDTRPERWTLM